MTTTLLEGWFLPERMKRYSASPDAEALYIWDTRLAKCFLEDLTHVEVLLRNFISCRLAVHAGTSMWYKRRELYNFTNTFCDAVERAEARLTQKKKPLLPGSVMAELSFDNWRFLLAKKYESTVWKQLIAPANGGMRHFPSRNRAEFERTVAKILHRRNRASHHEPLVLSAKETTKERNQIDDYQESIFLAARRIDPEAEAWIRKHSRVAQVRSQRPSVSAS